MRNKKRTLYLQWVKETPEKIGRWIIREAPIDVTCRIITHFAPKGNEIHIPIESIGDFVGMVTDFGVEVHFEVG